MLSVNPMGIFWRYATADKCYTKTFVADYVRRDMLVYDRLQGVCLRLYFKGLDYFSAGLTAVAPIVRCGF